jgi:hypothetical protein
MFVGVQVQSSPAQDPSLELGSLGVSDRLGRTQSGVADDPSGEQRRLGFPPVSEQCPPGPWAPAGSRLGDDLGQCSTEEQPMLQSSRNRARDIHDNPRRLPLPCDSEHRVVVTGGWRHRVRRTADACVHSKGDSHRPAWATSSPRPALTGVSTQAAGGGDVVQQSPRDVHVEVPLIRCRQSQRCVHDRVRGAVEAQEVDPTGVRLDVVKIPSAVVEVNLRPALARQQTQLRETFVECVMVRRGRVSRRPVDRAC